MDGLVLGSSSGLGKFCAESLSHRGDNVVGVARKSNGSTLYRELKLDLTDYSCSKSAMRNLFSENLFDYLIFSCGGVIADTISDIEPQALTALFATNVGSLVIPLTEFVSQASKNSPRSIILISSVHARGEPERLSYSVTKAALEAFMVSSYKPLAQINISINCIRPGPIQSNMLDQSYAVGSPERDDYLADIPAGRFATFEDIWSHVDLLTSPTSAYTTGQCIEVAGGY